MKPHSIKEQITFAKQKLRSGDKDSSKRQSLLHDNYSNKMKGKLDKRNRGKYPEDER